MVSKASFYGKYRRLSQDYISEDDEQSIIEMFANYGVRDVQNLLAEGADVDEVDTFGFTPFIYILALNENPEVLSEVIKAGADVNGRFHFSINYDPSRMQRKVLLYGGTLKIEHCIKWEIEEMPLTVAAAKNPNPQIVNLLIEQGAIINDTNKYLIRYKYLFVPEEWMYKFGKESKWVEDDYERRCNALEVAVKFNNIEVVEVLLSSGIKLKTYGGEKRTSLLQYAIELTSSSIPPSFKDILKLERNDVNNENIHDAVNHIVWSDSTGNFDEIFDMLYSNGFDINGTGRNGRTLLSYWTQSEANDKPELSTILNRGADPNIADEDGNTPLHYLCEHYMGKDSDLENLLKHGANVNATNKKGDTPLHLLCANDRQFKYALKLLLNYGAEVNVKNRNNETPLSLLLMNFGYNPDCDGLLALLKHGAEIPENKVNRINELLAQNADKYNLKLGKNNQLIAQITGGGGKESSTNSASNKQMMKLYIAIFFIFLVLYCIFVYFGGAN